MAAKMGRIAGLAFPSRRTIKLKERYIFLILVLTVIVFSITTIFLIPDLRSSSADKVYQVYVHVQNAAPDILIPQPSSANELVGDNPDKAELVHWGGINKHGQMDEPDPHLLSDKERLKKKIDASETILEKPKVQDKAEDGEAPVIKHRGHELRPDSDVDNTDKSVVITSGGEDNEDDIRKKRDTVKQMMAHAWKNYEEYAWGGNELRPISLKTHNPGIFGAAQLGATIIDALDTLYIMGFTKEFEKAKQWTLENLNFSSVGSDISVFETNIRFVGGLLTVYALTGDYAFAAKADEIAQLLLPAFNTPTGIPNALINAKTGIGKNYNWASGGAAILSEFGTLHLEFSYLSDVTGNPVYREKIEQVRKVIREIPKPNGLYPNYLNSRTGKWGQTHMSLGALGDSFYEYLLKAYLQSGKEDSDARTLYIEAMEAIDKWMIRESRSGLLYVSDMKYERLEHKMDHLACFSGGMFALGAHTLHDSSAARHMDIGKGLTNTCHESYIRSETGLGPEAFRFSDGLEARALKSNEKYYILRPEVVESYFILWRLTKDKKYREWGWEAVQALEAHCRVDHGYSGIKNVYNINSQKDDVQQSFLLAETLKYLYLLFSDDRLISLDQWVFNTEAHPLPIKGSNPFYLHEKR
ncbi:mannosyl-oligosaccharide 1,2-alpha-mannosidase IA-like isoform X2 [Artemia franciscana]